MLRRTSFVSAGSTNASNYTPMTSRHVPNQPEQAGRYSQTGLLQRDEQEVLKVASDFDKKSLARGHPTDALENFYVRNQWSDKTVWPAQGC
jgi:hypothetical protein